MIYGRRTAFFGVAFNMFAKRFFWLIGLWGMATSAVCVNGHPSVQSEFRTSKVVVLATVKAMEKVPESQDGDFLDGTVYHVTIERRFKGDGSSSLDIFSENSSGRFDMLIGGSYLLFINEEDRRLSVDNCGNSGPANKRANTIHEVTKLARQIAS